MDLNILAIIPARSGSKSVKDKNIRLMNGKPLLVYSIEHAIGSSYINRIIVSTDSEKYADIAKKAGAEVPFLRPHELAKDDTLDYDVFEHLLNTLKRTENYLPDIVVQLRPTYPIRSIKEIDNMIEIILGDTSVDSVRCIAPAKEIAYKMWRESKDGTIVPLLNDIKEAYNMPRQQLPQIYYQNACVDVIRTSTILEMRSMSGKKIVGYKMHFNFDIDTEEDFARAEKFLKLRAGGNRFVFDIDGVVAKYDVSLKYDKVLSNEKIIEAINYLYDCGNKITLFTSRENKEGFDWEKVTVDQINAWGLKYHELKFGKPPADFYLDDKMLDISELFSGIFI